MATPLRAPHLVHRRVVRRWERLVQRLAILAEEQKSAEAAKIEAILQIAQDLGNRDPAVGRILCEYAYNLMHYLDPNSDGRGVLQFKTSLLLVLKKRRPVEEGGGKIDRSHDVQKLQEFYRRYREENSLDQFEEEGSIRRHSDTYNEDWTITEQRPKLLRIVYNTTSLLNEVIDALTKASHFGVMLEKLNSYFEPTKVCMEGIQGMSIPKFNNEQCGYLLEKLEATANCAMFFIEEQDAQRHELVSLLDLKIWVETFKLLLVLAKQIERFFQDCCKDAWIQSALSLAHVREYVSSIGFNLELCKVALRKEQGVMKRLTMNEVGKLNETEVESVDNIALADAKYLFNIASDVADSSNMAKCLLGTLRGDMEDPYFVNDNSSHYLKLFECLSLGKEKRIGAGTSANVYEVNWLGTRVAKKTFDGPDNQEFWREAKVLS